MVRGSKAIGTIVGIGCAIVFCFAPASAEQATQENNKATEQKASVHPHRKQKRHRGCKNRKRGGGRRCDRNKVKGCKKDCGRVRKEAKKDGTKATTN
jgi:hypothetical protein